jgi:hypothetical protein
MPSEWLQVVFSVLFVSVWLIVGQIIATERRQARQTLCGAKNA